MLSYHHQDKLMKGGKKVPNDELTKEQTERQDLVDNTIIDMLHSLSERYDIAFGMAGLDKVLGTIRVVVCEWLEEMNIMSSMNFYPYLKEGWEKCANCGLTQSETWSPCGTDECPFPRSSWETFLNS